MDNDKDNDNDNYKDTEIIELLNNSFDKIELERVKNVHKYVNETLLNKIETEFKRKISDGILHPSVIIVSNRFEEYCKAANNDNDNNYTVCYLDNDDYFINNDINPIYIPDEWLSEIAKLLKKTKYKIQYDYESEDLIVEHDCGFGKTDYIIKYFIVNM